MTPLSSTCVIIINRQMPYSSIMTLSIYNTLTRRQEQFTTVEPGKVKMYCCGVTVYDYCHLGNARTSIIWDIVRS